MRFTSGGKGVTEFSAGSGGGKGSNGKAEETIWTSVKSWEGMGEAVNEGISKGMAVRVEGRLKLRKDDKGRSYLNVTASKITAWRKGQTDGPGVVFEEEKSDEGGGGRESDSAKVKALLAAAGVGGLDVERVMAGMAANSGKKGGDNSGNGRVGDVERWTPSSGLEKPA